ncbi:hypothetical protein C7M84_025433 [Penaeus vannamei]|uniref:Uncharacterized protein n=1 Tax=Penaeus vannamei TaxID=6689 RepID=A0A423TY87_PENVA|nr:hypothetical protein C7M84_025433 [Penaeus vannamei]
MLTLVVSGNKGVFPLRLLGTAGDSLGLTAVVFRPPFSHLRLAARVPGAAPRLPVSLLACLPVSLLLVFLCLFSVPPCLPVSLFSRRPASLPPCLPSLPVSLCLFSLLPCLTVSLRPSFLSPFFLAYLSPCVSFPCLPVSLFLVSLCLFSVPPCVPVFASPCLFAFLSSFPPYSLCLFPSLSPCFLSPCVSFPCFLASLSPLLRVALLLCLPVFLPSLSPCFLFLVFLCLFFPVSLSPLLFVYCYLSYYHPVSFPQQFFSSFLCLFVSYLCFFPLLSPFLVSLPPFFLSPVYLLFSHPPYFSFANPFSLSPFLLSSPSLLFFPYSPITSLASISVLLLLFISFFLSISSLWHLLFFLFPLPPFPALPSLLLLFLSTILFSFSSNHLFPPPSLSSSPFHSS